MTRILIVDDHPIVRQGVRQIVEAASDLKVTAEATTGLQALDQVRRTPLDLVILDLSLPDSDGLEILKQIKDERPQLPVVILTMHSEDQFAIRSLKAGASGYVTKDSAPSELVVAIRRVVHGGRYITAAIAEKLVQHLGPDSNKRPHERLSDREYQVLRMIANGRSTREIAEALSLSVKTVGTYRGRVLGKMKLKNAAELAAYVVRNHLAD